MSSVEFNLSYYSFEVNFPHNYNIQQLKGVDNSNFKTNCEKSQDKVIGILNDQDIYKMLDEFEKSAEMSWTLVKFFASLIDNAEAHESLGTLNPSSVASDFINNK